MKNCDDSIFSRDSIKLFSVHWVKKPRLPMCIPSTGICLFFIFLTVDKIVPSPPILIKKSALPLNPS